MNRHALLRLTSPARHGFPERQFSAERSSIPMNCHAQHDLLIGSLEHHLPNRNQRLGSFTIRQFSGKRHGTFGG